MKLKNFFGAKVARKVIEAQDGPSGIVCRIDNEFGNVIVFTDPEARNAYERVCGHLACKSTESVLLDGKEVDIVWGQVKWA